MADGDQFKISPSSSEWTGTYSIGLEYVDFEEGADFEAEVFKFKIENDGDKTSSYLPAGSTNMTKDESKSRLSISGPIKRQHNIAKGHTSLNYDVKIVTEPADVYSGDVKVDLKFTSDTSGIVYIQEHVDDDGSKGTFTFNAGPISYTTGSGSSGAIASAFVKEQFKFKDMESTTVMYEVGWSNEDVSVSFGNIGVEWFDIEFDNEYSDSSSRTLTVGESAVSTLKRTLGGGVNTPGSVHADTFISQYEADASDLTIYESDEVYEIQ